MLLPTRASDFVHRSEHGKAMESPSFAAAANPRSFAFAETVRTSITSVRVKAPWQLESLASS
jgi:hypothetical protein